MERKYDHDSNIIFVDAHGVRHSAFATAWWGRGTYDGDVYGTKDDHGTSSSSEPGCNLVYISKSLTEKDSCGRQMKRETSVVHKSKQSAHGMYWCWPDEV